MGMDGKFGATGIANSSQGAWSGIGSAAVGAAGGILGMIGQGKRARKAHNRNKELMGMQFANQQALNKQGQELQMKTWRDTGYSAQMQMMKEAGLNPGLMYGMSGGGGQTTGSQGGGSASGNSSHAPMDIGAVIQASLAGAQKGLIDSQKRKTEAETNEINDRTDKIAVDKEKVVQEIENLKRVANTEKERTALVKLQGLFESSKIDNMKRNTELVGKKISESELEAELKRYEVGLNKLGIQKTDNKVFRFLTNLASKFGWDFGSLLKNYMERAEENKDKGIFGEPNNNRY